MQAPIGPSTWHDDTGEVLNVQYRTIPDVVTPAATAIQPTDLVAVMPSVTGTVNPEKMAFESKVTDPVVSESLWTLWLCRVSGWAVANPYLALGLVAGTYVLFGGGRKR